MPIVQPNAPKSANKHKLPRDEQRASTNSLVQGSARNREQPHTDQHGDHKGMGYQEKGITTHCDPTNNPRHQQENKPGTTDVWRPASQQHQGKQASIVLISGLIRYHSVVIIVGQLDCYNQNERMKTEEVEL